MRKVTVRFAAWQPRGFQYEVMLVQGPATIMSSTLHATEEEADRAARDLAALEGVPYIPRLR
jgi:hypothetical protein